MRTTPSEFNCHLKVFSKILYYDLALKCENTVDVMSTGTEQWGVNLMLAKQIFHIAISCFLARQQPSDLTKEGAFRG